MDWSPTAWQGDQKWVYEMVFSADFDSIVGGGVEAISVNGAAVLGGCSSFVVFFFFSPHFLGVATRWSTHSRGVSGGLGR